MKTSKAQRLFENCAVWDWAVLRGNVLYHDLAGDPGDILFLGREKCCGLRFPALWQAKGWGLNVFMPVQVFVILQQTEWILSCVPFAGVSQSFCNTPLRNSSIPWLCVGTILERQSHWGEPGIGGSVGTVQKVTKKPKKSQPLPVGIRGIPQILV